MHAALFRAWRMDRAKTGSCRCFSCILGVKFKMRCVTKEPIKAYIEKLSHDGRGIARILGKTTFIAGALPCETVYFRYIRRKKDYDEGRVVEVLEAAADRVV